MYLTGKSMQSWPGMANQCSAIYITIGSYVIGDKRDGDLIAIAVAIGNTSQTKYTVICI